MPGPTVASSLISNGTLQKKLLNNKSFLYLWLAGSASSFTLSMYMLIEEWYVVSFLKMPNMLGIVSMFSLLPRVILMFVGGSLADRMRRSKILFFSDFLRGILVAIMAVLFTFGWLTLYPLLFAALIFGVLDAFYWPANNALVPNLVSKAELVRANSLIQSTNKILLIGGPAIGATFISLINYQGSFLVLALLLLIGSLLNIKIKENENAEGPMKKRQSIFSDFRETIAYIKSVPYLLTSMGTSIVINFFFSGPISVGIPILVKDCYHGDSFALSFMEGTFSVGMVIGAVIIGVINLKKKRAVANLFMIAGMDVFAILLSQTSVLWEGLLCISVLGLILSASNVNGPSISQSIIDPKFMGRVQSLQSAVGMGLTPLSFALVSFLLSAGLPLSNLLLVASSIGLLFIVGVLLSVRSLWRID